MLWECPAYSSCRFLEKLQELLRDNYSSFDSLNNLEKMSYMYVLGSELWEDDFSLLLSIVKEFLIDVLETRNYIVIMHVLAPSLTLRGGILVRMVSCGMVGMAGVVS